MARRVEVPDLRINHPDVITELARAQQLLVAQFNLKPNARINTRTMPGPSEDTHVEATNGDTYHNDTQRIERVNHALITAVLRVPRFEEALDSLGSEFVVERYTYSGDDPRKDDSEQNDIIEKTKYGVDITHTGGSHNGMMRATTYSGIETTISKSEKGKRRKQKVTSEDETSDIIYTVEQLREHLAAGLAAIALREPAESV
jgi:hypothetical protein